MHFFFLLSLIFNVRSTGRHNVDSLAKTVPLAFPVELLLNVCENDKLRLGESWGGYEAFCE